MTGKTLMEEQTVAWRYKSDAPKAKWTVQKNEPTHIQKSPGYTVEPLYSAAYVRQLEQERDELRRAMEKLLRTAEDELHDADHALGVYEARAALNASNREGGEE